MSIAQTCELTSCSNPPVKNREHCSRHYYLNKPRKQEEVKA